LATIVVDVPIDLDEEALAYEGFDEGKLKALFEE
jgi:hypothetical protein